jgi:hypothetical protein
MVQLQRTTPRLETTFMHPIYKVKLLPCYPMITKGKELIGITSIDEPRIVFTCFSLVAKPRTSAHRFPTYS